MRAFCAGKRAVIKQQIVFDQKNKKYCKHLAEVKLEYIFFVKQNSIF